MLSLNDIQLDAIADALVTHGYLIVDDFIHPSLAESLVMQFELLQGDAFKPAGIGRQTDFQRQETIRSDNIRWIENTSDAEKKFLTVMECLRVGINQRLFMGLFDYESHFAHYPVGAFYKKHLDAFRSHVKEGQSNRVLSTVLYLNNHWLPEYGGELLIYAENGDKVIERVVPVMGRLVIFLSEKFPHEVLPASRERKSIAGWFRVNEGVMP